jgi:serine/threonine protein kinase
MRESEANEAGTEQEQLLAEIHVFVGSELIAKYAIEHGEYIIGRDAHCPVVVDADLVSRHHARLTFNAFELVIEDLGSSNGVFIDGVQVQLPTRVRLDQEVQIGSARLFIRLRDAAAKQLAEALWDKDLGLAQVREQLEGKKYKVITTINRGGMGVILQTRDLRIRRTVAMKVMKTSNQFSRENVLRFIDEAQLTGQLEHPNIVPVYELGLDDQGEIYYTMKFVKGTTLDDVLRNIKNGRQKVIDKYPLGALLTIFQKVCDAVAYAHSKGVVHRDLKPENIMIGSFGEVMVMDWGLAKNITGSRREGPVEPTPEAVVMQARATLDDLRGFETLHGLIVGTPPYISPEQARGELDRIDARSDIYVLGGILYAILALRPPVEGETVHEVVDKIVTSSITPPSSLNPAKKNSRRMSGTQLPDAVPEIIVYSHCPGKRIPESLSAVTMKALALDPADRYQNVEDLQADIAAFQGGFATKAERAGWLKHALLFAGRHKKEVALFLFFFAVFNVLVIGFFLQLTAERDRALRGEQRALEQQNLADQRLHELRGTAPTFAAEAQQLLDDHKPVESLEKIDYAISQVPNDAAFHNLRGNILQAQLRLEEAIESYEQALRLNPKLKEAEVNRDLSRSILNKIGLNDEQPRKELLAELYTALINQGRRSAAENIESQFGVDKQKLHRFNQNRLKQRFETNPDNTINVDLSKTAKPDFEKLRDVPVSGLNLDDTKIADIDDLRGLQLQSLSLSRVQIHDLSPLTGMPLRTLNLEGTAVTDLSPLSALPLEVLRLSNTRVTDLSPLSGSRIEQLILSNCRFLKDLTPLRGLPLQTLTINRTGVTDLSPLTESPLREVNLEGCAALTNLQPLMEIGTLESVMIPLQAKDIEFLRAHPGIKRISYKKMTESAEDFWKAYDEAKLRPPPPGPAPRQARTPKAGAAAAAATPRADQPATPAPGQPATPATPPAVPPAPPVPVPAPERK